MAFDMVLIKKGMLVPRKGLLDQSRYHRVLEEKYRPALHAAGWRPEDLAGFCAALEILESQMAQTVEARADSRENRKDEQAGVDETKAYKRKLVLAVKVLHSDGLVRDEDRKVIEKSGQLRRSTPAILDYLIRIRDTVARYDAELKPFFGGTSALALLDVVKTQLDRFQGIQEQNLAALPQETLKVYEAKGRLLSYIERINHIGKIAFDGQALIMAEFNKDLLLRARQQRRTQSGIEPASEIDAKAAASEGD